VARIPAVDLPLLWRHTNPSQMGAHGGSLHDWGFAVVHHCQGTLHLPDDPLACLVCTASTGTTHWYAQIGVFNVYDWRNDGCVRSHNVIRIINHPQYDPYDNDVSLLELESPSDYPFIQRLEDAASPIGVPGHLVTVAGWGDTSSGGSSSIITHHVEVPIVDQVLWSLLMKVFEAIHQ